jgi:uncharacterized membrane-anchored protein
MKNTHLNSLNKVPLVTAFFWIIKIMATTVGETAADYLNFNLKLGLDLTSAVMAVLLLVFLFLQFRAKKYIPWLYWINVLLISVAGTLITDNLVDNVGVTLPVTTTIFSVFLGLTFFFWFRSEGTLSIHTINNTKRELFYWLAILFTFALGTSAGDLVAEGFSLGYSVSMLIFGGLIATITFAYYKLGLGEILSFWIIYILTRPLGASFADLVAQSNADGGLGLGMENTSLVFIVIILILVGYLSLTKKDNQDKTDVA